MKNVNSFGRVTLAVLLSILLIKDSYAGSFGTKKSYDEATLQIPLATKYKKQAFMEDSGWRLQRKTSAPSSKSTNTGTHVIPVTYDDNLVAAQNISVQNIAVQAATLHIIPASTVLTPDDISLPMPSASSFNPISPGTQGASSVAYSIQGGFKLNYITGTAGWSGGGVTYDTFSTVSVETADLSGISVLVVGLKGTPQSVKCEFVDGQGNKATVTLTGVSSTTEKVWQVPISFLNGVDLTKVQSVNFIVEGQNQSGTLEVYTKIAPVSANIPASTTLTTNDINIPGQSLTNPAITTIAPIGATSSVTLTTRGEILQYNTSTAGWSGGGFTYDNFSTAGIEVGDLSALSNLVVGLKGTPTQVKAEIVDSLGNKASIKLTGISSTTENVWSIPASLLTAQGVNLANVRLIYFIAEGTNQTGTLEINRIAGSGAPQSLNIAPSSLTAQDVNLPVTGVTPIAPLGAASTTTATSIGETITYNTNSAGWSGGGFTYDNFATAAIETSDLGGLSNIVVGLQGTPAQVKFEIIDSNNNKASVTLTGISSSTENFWSIPASLLSSQGVNLNNVRLVYFIVEGNNQSGALQVRVSTSQVIVNIPASTTLTTQDINILSASVQTVAPAGATSTIAPTPTGATLAYDTSAAGWAGGGFTYDNSSTPEVETADFSTLGNIVIGLEGNPTAVKFEVTDSQNHKASVRLTGISSVTENVWTVPPSLLTAQGVDLTSVRFVNFIVEGTNQTGSLNIYVGSHAQINIPASTALTSADIDLPGLGSTYPAITAVNPPGTTANVTVTTRGETLQYNTGTAGWSGGGFTYDDFSTSALETADMSSLDNIVIGLKGSTNEVKFEIIDNSGNKASVKLTGINSITEKFWSIPTSLLAAQGVALTNVRLIYFIVEGANQTGTLEINRLPV